MLIRLLLGSNALLILNLRFYSSFQKSTFCTIFRSATIDPFDNNINKMKRNATKKVASDEIPPEIIPASVSKKRKVTTSKEESVDNDKIAANDGDDQSTNSEKNTASTIYPRDAILPLSIPSNDGHKYLKVISWNVNGLKAVISTRAHIFQNLVDTHKPDILCLQETKLQETLVNDYRDLLPGYESFWSCSTVKKGYSGTAVFIKKSALIKSSQSQETKAASKPSSSQKQAKLSAFFTKPSAKESAPNDATITFSKETTDAKTSFESVSYDFTFNGEEFSGEGRVITVDTELFTLVNCYVPNAGEGLKRLDYRVKSWDPSFFGYLRHLNAKKPVILTGDLNVGHLDLDIYNPDAKHIVKQAGLTPEERQSFGSFVSAPSKFRDAFRALYPTAVGQFTYWSMRTFARPKNNGIRLDYFICSEELFEAFHKDKRKSESSGSDSGGAVVYDSYVIHEDTNGCSDHCPVALVIKI